MFLTKPLARIFPLPPPLDNFPGRPTNPVGFAAAPGYPGSLTPSSGPFTSGSPGNPTIVSFKDFDAGVSSTNINADWITFVGCRFQSNAISANNVSSGGTGCRNIIFSYCSFTPRAALYTGPPGLAWPSAGAGLQTTTFVNDVNCVNGVLGYQYGFDCHNLTDGPITWDHCDLWGYGNAINFIGHTAQMTMQDCWIHDCANAAPQGYHTDGPGYLNGGTPPQNILCDHCTIASIGNTNAWAFQAATSAYVNIKVRRSFFSGMNVCVEMCRDVLSSTGLEFTDNIFGTDLPWVNGPIGGASMFISNGFPVNVWRRNTLRVLPGTSTIAGQQFSWVPTDDGKYVWPDATLHSTDYTG
jgi:hypothetical protein